MLNINEVEMLAGILSRAGVTQIEAIWCNGILDILRRIALEQQAKDALEQKKGDAHDK